MSFFKPKIENPMAQQETKTLGNISLKTYYNFFKAGGGIMLFSLALLLFVFGEVGPVTPAALLVVFDWHVYLHIQASIVVSDWWLADW